MDAWLACTVTPGQFSAEFAVSAEQVGGEGFSLFAGRSLVDVDKEPTSQEPRKGWLKVTIWDRKGDQVLVRLPQPSFESGQFVTVSASQLDTKEKVG